MATSVDLTTLFRNALVLAKQEKFDVYNALDIMENKEVFNELNFGVGSGSLYYYLYNWSTPDLTPIQIGTILV